MKQKRGILAGLALTLLASGAAAQSAVPPNTPGPTVPERIQPPAGNNPVLPRGGAPGPGGDSVIAPPPGIDPQIHVPAPNPQPNSTPVIPPPGSPGGDSTVQPR